MTIHPHTKRDRIRSKIGFGASIAQDVSNAGWRMAWSVQCDATTLLNINHNKKLLEGMMANSAQSGEKQHVGSCNSGALANPVASTMLSWFSQACYSGYRSYKSSPSCLSHSLTLHEYPLI